MAIGLGCMRLSTDPARDPDRGRAVITAAITGGIELLNTADAYALDDSDIGHNERLIAEAVRSAGRPIEIATKGGLVRPGGAWQCDGRARHLAAAARASRDRLGVAAIDLYLLHAVGPKVPLATSVRALARLRDDGVVRRIGLSNVNLPQLEAALAIAPIDAVEVELSPWKLDAVRGGLVAACATRGIRVLAYRPLGGPAGVRRAAADPVLAEHAQRLGATSAELVLAWLAQVSPVIVPLPGATREATARSAARAQAIVLDEETRAALDGRWLTVGDPAVRSVHAMPPPTDPDPAATRSIHALPLATDPDPAATQSSHPIPLTTDPDPAATQSSHPIPRAVDSAPPARSGDAIPRAVDSAPPARSGDAIPLAVDQDLPAPSAATDPTRAEVVMVIGMPASGKSTLAAGYAARGYLRLNRDELGGSLADIAHRLDRALARGTHRIVLDNTYPTRATRAPIIAIARRHGASVRCVVMATSLEQAQHNAVARILGRHGRLLMPGGPGQASELGRAGEIDPRALFRFRRTWEPPRSDEGFAAIEEVAFSRATAPCGEPALIVELDGVVWRQRPPTPEQIELLPGARDALAAWSQHRVLAGTTWQPGLASTAPLAARLTDLVGAPIAIAHCGHPAGPPVCWCRKPLPGLALALAHSLGLDLARTLHLGKGPADRGFAARAGMRYVDIAAGWPAPE